MTQQLGGPRISMSPAEIRAFLRAAPTCQVRFDGPSSPVAQVLRFIYDGMCLWIEIDASCPLLTGLDAEAAGSVVVDSGENYLDMRGVEMVGALGVVGEVPCLKCTEPELLSVEPEFAQKYFSAAAMSYDGAHAWLRLSPRVISSWDFRKLVTLDPGA